MKISSSKSVLGFSQTEQIRRINRLWASDSLFLREYLLVPVSPDTPSPSQVRPDDSTNVSIDG